ncbi:MAG: LLM class flavin-dependent oxidoreductase [Actinomycetota bacterium]|nr:LLM class flavin-dependent oxidoreductase [Actinomycetota bacterium]
MKRLATFISGGKSLEQTLDRVRLAEQLGYEAVFDTHIAARDGLMLLAAYANATTRIKVGTGVLPAFPRHPVSLAGEAATLDEISSERLILGIGPSHRITMENWYGLPMEKPLTQMKEYVAILRDIFTKGAATFSGEFYRGSYAFMGYKARTDIPIYVSALAPNMLRWAGAAADGVILWGCLPSYIERVVTPTVRAGAEEAGRDPASVEIVAAIPTALTSNAAAGYDALRGDFFTYMMLPFYRRAIEGAGYGDEIKAFDEANGRGDMAAAKAAMSERMMSEFGAIGDEATIDKKYQQYRDAGVSLPAVGLFQAGDGFAGIEATLEAAIR